MSAALAAVLAVAGGAVFAMGAVRSNRRRAAALLVVGAVLLGAAAGGSLAGAGAGLAAVVAAVLAVVVVRLPDREVTAAASPPDPVDVALGDVIVREVMVPRTDMVTIPASAPLDELTELVAREGLSRIPVTGAGLDDIVGVALAKDLLVPPARPTHAVGDVTRPVRFIPETMSLTDLLPLMRGSGSHLVIVVDEYGGTAGLVTFEDVLEELVGDIVDEFDGDEGRLVTSLPEGGWEVDGRLPVREIGELTGTTFPDGEFDSVGGLVLGLAGRIPGVGESFVVEGVELTVSAVRGRRIAGLRVQPVTVAAGDQCL